MTRFVIRHHISDTYDPYFFSIFSYSCCYQPWLLSDQLLDQLQTPNLNSTLKLS